MQECRRPLNVAPLTLNITNVGTLVVPFGSEPAEVVADFFTAARRAGIRLTGDDAALVMDSVCRMKSCHSQLDVSPIRLNVSGVGTLVVPFGHEPAEDVANFLLEARAKGHRILADGAELIMRAVCQQTRCEVPLDVSPTSLNISGVGRIVVPFGEEPAQAVHRFTDQVVRQGGTLNAAAAQQIFEALCKQVICRCCRRGCGCSSHGVVPALSVSLLFVGPFGRQITCFQPLDVSSFSLNITNVGTLVVPYGVEPSDAVDYFLRQAIRQGHQIDQNGAQQIMDVVCQRLACHRPLDMTPFSLEISDVGTLMIPYGVEPAVAVADFVGRALDAGHRIGANGVDVIMQRVCAVRRSVLCAPLLCSDAVVDRGRCVLARSRSTRPR
jgi:hypothetical protein